MPCIVGIFNAVLSRYEKNEETNECTLFFESESDEKQMYSSILRFLNSKELLKYKEETKDRIIKFKDAQKNHKYLIREQ